MNSAHRQSPGCRFLEAALHLVAKEGSPKARLTTLLREKEKSKTTPPPNVAWPKLVFSWSPILTG